MRGFAGKRRVALTSGMLALSLVTAACGDDGGSEEPADTGSGASEVLGAEKEATGEPVKIGFSSEGRSAALDASEDIEAAKAVVAYANKHLGGIAGRPIELSVVCENKSLPATARECGNQFVQSDIVALVSGPTGTVDSVLDVTSPAGLPYLNAAATQKVSTLPNSFVVNNTLGALIGVPAVLAKEEGYKSVTVVTIDVPAAVGPVKQLGALAFGNAGAKLNVTAVPPGTPDMTPQIQAALNDKPELFHVVGDPSFCTSALKAMRTLNVTQPIMIVASCVGPDGASQIPGGYKDLDVSTYSAVEAGSEEGELLETVLDTFGEGLEVNTPTQSGYQVMLSFVRAMKDFTGEPTRESVSKHLSAMPSPQPLPLSNGGTFQCGSKPIALTPNVCTAVAIRAKTNEDGSLTDVTTVDTSEVLKLPAS